MKSFVRAAFAVVVLFSFVGASQAQPGEGGPPPTPQPIPQPPPNYNPALPSEGLTLGYWKNHPESWPITYWHDGAFHTLSPKTLISDVFPSSNFVNGIGSLTLMDALNFKGGTGVAGAERILLKQAVASLLNASSVGVVTPLDINFPLEEWQVVDQVTAALNSNDRATMLDLGATLDGLNSLELTP